MTIKDICPYCVQQTELEQIVGDEAVVVRGESISVPSTYFHCLRCNQDFDDPRAEDDVLDLAYREYRRRNNMLQPEEIREFRKKFNLTQKELCELLSWGEVTISRYEKGKLQENGHDTLLRLIQNPINMLDLIRKKQKLFTPEKKEVLTEQLTKMVQLENNFVDTYQSIFGNYDKNIFSGWQKLNISKVITMIRFFCYPSGQFKTKLNKLLFYADFEHYAKHETSITGLQYVKMQYGPVPSNYERYQVYLIENDMIEIEEIVFPDDSSGEKLKSKKGPDLSCFSESEVHVLTKVKDLFNSITCKKISDISHEEEAYINTKDRNFISYEYANSLKASELLGEPSKTKYL
tara:strand:+ start:5625 stop:6668 length:1044 start_codon:yes stop_codon:yes gene_type:complete